MPQAVMHILLTIFVIDIFRDYIIKNKKLIPLKYVLIGGIAGLLPDIDIPLSWLFNHLLGISLPWTHRTLSHSLVFPLILLLIAIFYNQFNRKKAVLFGVITFGCSFHILLDYLFVGSIVPFYPFSTAAFGLDLFSYVKVPAFVEGLEALILIAWLYYEEKRHKISDFI